MPSRSVQSTVVRTSRGLSIAGTRITLYDIMDYVRAEWPTNLIRHWFNLSDQQITDVMTYIAEHRDVVEAEYQAVLDDADAVRAYWEERNRDRLDRISRLPAKPGQEAIVAKLRARKAALDMR